ncbi:MAG: DNA repair protein RecO [Halobacteriovoraceae bacterium]|nr:DNA repair protein RecO [Halobacteriovoraceae bacterium]MCB9095948.1 DNA repair protein RecO [Halobacteriovoraceae bacterium]
MQLQGILLNKKKFQERNLIADIILRNGHRTSAIFYGGQGGGKKHKPSQLEVGNLVSFPLLRKPKEGQMQAIREWKLDWEHIEIRKNYKAFYLLHFYSELIRKVIPDEQRFDQNQDGEFFNLLSNAIFYLENSLVQNNFLKSNHLSLFLVKLLYYLGVYPALLDCLYCGDSLHEKNLGSFNFQEGGATCRSCEEQSSLEDLQLYSCLKNFKNIPFKELSSLRQGQPLEVSKRLTDYFLTHFQLFPRDLHSYSFIFN